MSGGKGGSTQTTQVKLPEVLERAAKENLALADRVGKVGFTPNLGPTVAGFAPGQTAAMANTNQAAQAFGMQGGGNVDDYMMGESFNNGAAYGGAPIYEDMLARMDPEQRALIESFVGVNGQGAGEASGGSKGGDKGGKLNFRGNGSGGGMWSDGMTGRQISAERAAGTFGSGMPSSQRGQSFGSPASSGTVNSGGLY